MPQSPCTPNMVLWGALEPRDLVSVGFAREACIFRAKIMDLASFITRFLTNPYQNQLELIKKRQKKLQNMRPGHMTPLIN